MTTPAIQHFADQLATQTAKVVIGADRVVRRIAIALVARGHVLIEGPPGLGKTLLAKCIAHQLGGEFRRVQCTPDLVPSDLTGTHVLRPATQTFEFVPGPLFADVVLVDELNRTGPRTQSALLEAMEERNVTSDRQTFPLPDEFLVIATQNPHEFEGTYPLPESQLDRFLLRLSMGHPDPAVETAVLRTYDTVTDRRESRIAELPVLEPGLLQRAREEAGSVTVSDALYEYVTTIAAASRSHSHISLGISTRGALALVRCARIDAALGGATFVTPDHIKGLAEAALSHRLIPAPEAMLEGIDAPALVASILERVPVPRGTEASANG